MKHNSDIYLRIALDIISWKMRHHGFHCRNHLSKFGKDICSNNLFTEPLLQTQYPPSPQLNYFESNFTSPFPLISQPGSLLFPLPSPHNHSDILRRDSSSLQYNYQYRQGYLNLELLCGLTCIFLNRRLPGYNAEQFMSHRLHQQLVMSSSGVTLLQLTGSTERCGHRGLPQEQK
jgi:hypothetical protein